MGAVHLLKEIVVVRFDGGAHQPQNEDTTMLNTTDKIIKHKTGLLNLAEELGNVSKACQVMGMSTRVNFIVSRSSAPCRFSRWRPVVALIAGLSERMNQPCAGRL